MDQIRVMVLEDGKNYNSTLFRLEKGWVIRFTLESAIQWTNVKLFCNHPTIKTDIFHRDRFHQINWLNKLKSMHDVSERYGEVKIISAGAFQFYLENEENGEKYRKCHGCFVVDPVLNVAANQLHLDSITIQTILTKCLGPFSQWNNRLQVAYESGYNMFHFSPIQELGDSNSSYSVKNHLLFNPMFNDKETTLTEDKLKSFVNNLQSDWKMLSIVDVVWNHASNDSEWIQANPEAAYNLVNSPHLRPAFLLDRALWYFNKEIMEGKWVKNDVPVRIYEEKHLDALYRVLRTLLTSLRLHEFYTLDVNSHLNKFNGLYKDIDELDKENLPALEIVQDQEYKRFGCTIDMDLAMKLCYQHCKLKIMTAEKKETCYKYFQQTLEELNQNKMEFIQNLHNAIAYSVIGHVRYHFIDVIGPRYGTVTEKHSISVRYFSYPFPDTSYDNDCKLLNSPKAELVMAHNGWVMGGDALDNFAAPHSMVYLRRQLIAWGDSIKLRYGDKPDDSPFLWNLMKEYTQQMAHIFHGLRIDNCHSTPIHVAEYFLDCAREVCPDLYVIAELFTNSEATDNAFINRLGLNSLIRESLGAVSAYDLGRHVHRYGGQAVGSFLKPSTCSLQPSMARAIFMDATHDNQSSFDVRSVFDMLSSAALVSATCCASGSNRGYDELVPHHINVVTEERRYQSWSETTNGNGLVNLKQGIINAKRALNKLHIDLQDKGYTQIYVDQVTDDIVAVTRHAPETTDTVIIVAHCAFQWPAAKNYPSLNYKQNYEENITPLEISGNLDEVLLEAQLFQINDDNSFVKSTEFINGHHNFVLLMQENIQIDQSKMCKLVADKIQFTNFLPGSVIAFKVSLKRKVKHSVDALRYALSQFPEQHFNIPCPLHDVNDITDVAPIISKLNLVDLNYVLYRCDNEEKDDGLDGGVYDIPGFGAMVYCGLQGIVSMMTPVRTNNDLGHPLCNNLRQGDWLSGYTANRLKHRLGTHHLALWLESVFIYLQQVPRYLVPCYFEAIISSVYVRCLEQAFSLMSKFVQDGSSFIKYLSLGSIQMCGVTKSAPLPPVHSHSTDLPTLAAGLPHFSTGFMRCWGRDTFIALRGTMLVTGRFQEARNLILAFAGCIRHGLIPNLLAGGVNARYNSRDATWFWLQAVQDFTKVTVEGADFLNAYVLRMYQTDDSSPQASQSEKVLLQDIIYEILQRHFEGITFCERNAGENLDRDMASSGFEQSIGIDKETGFVYGGNKDNCGTWMDKMGSSDIAKNKGHPATPRDGSAVELVGLCKSALRWLTQMNQLGIYKYDNVTYVNHQGKKLLWTYKDWHQKIADNFEAKFYVDESSTEDMVNKRNIYKDSYLSSNKFTDYQLRPNFPIAMCVAPELFDAKHAWLALNNIEKYLLGPMGLATLDPEDWAYDGYYENYLDIPTFNKAKGFNYHQGPEWTWVLGPFLRAKLKFAKLLYSGEELQHIRQQICKILSHHNHELASSSWRGLPELTNKNGAYCKHSCPTQAWSMACLLEVLYEINK